MMLWRSRLSLPTLLLAGLSVGAAADGMWQWPSLQRQQKAGPAFFSRCGPDQRDVLSAFLAGQRSRGIARVADLAERVRQDPLDLDRWHMLALAYEKRGNLLQALEQFRRIKAFDPTHPSRLHLAGFYERAGRPALALAALTDLAQRDPQAREARRRLARLCGRRDQWGAAAKALQELLALEPENVALAVQLAAALRRAGRASDALAVIREIGEDARSEASRLERARCLCAAGQWEGARQELEALVEADPRGPALRPLALLLLRQRQFEAAASAFERALADGNPSPELLAGAAAAAQGAGNDDEAADQCRTLRRLGHEELAGVLLASLWLGKSDAGGLHAACQSLPEEAGPLAAGLNALFQRTNGQPQRQREAAIQFSVCRVLLRAGWLAEAIQAGKAALDAVPDDLLLGWTLARCYRTAGRRAEALALHRQLAEQHPDSEAALFRYASACAEAGSRAEAAEACRTLLEQAPKHRDGRLLAARLAMGRGDFGDAAAHLERIPAGSPADQEVRTLLISALVADGKLSQAADAIREADRRVSADQLGAPEQALLSLADGHQERARALCRAALERRPLIPRLRRLVAFVDLQAGMLESALAHAQLAVLADPEDFWGRLLLARTAAKLGNLSTALDAYPWLAARAPHRTDLRLEWVDLLHRAHQATEAIRQLRKLRPRDAATRRDIEARLGRTHLLRGDPRRAIALAEGILHQDSSHALARGVAFRAYRVLGDLEAAARVAAREKAAAEPGAVGRLDLAMVRLLQGRPGEAAAHLSDLIAHEEKQPPAARFCYAVALLGSGRLEAAREAALRLAKGSEAQAATAAARAVLLTATGADEAARRAVQKIQPLEVAEWYRAALARFAQQPDLSRSFLAGAVARRHGWWRQARRFYEECRQSEPEAPALVHALFAASREAGQKQVVLRYARALVRLLPKSGTAQLLLGQALTAVGKQQHAQDAYKRAAERLGESDAHAWQILGTAFSELDLPQEAIQSYRRALKANPKSPAICNNLAWLYTRHQQNELAPAQQLAAKAVQLAPRNATCKDTLGWVQFFRGELVEATGHFTAALALDPNLASSYAGLGMVYLEQGRPRRARIALRQALALNPGLENASKFRATLRRLKSPR